MFKYIHFFSLNMDREAEKRGKREASKFIRDLKIITAISMGKNRNKDLAHFLNTDKSHASKKIKELEKKGLVYKEGERRNIIYRVNQSAVTRLLQSKVTIVRGGKKYGRKKESEN